MTTDIAVSLWASAATFKRGRVEKFSFILLLQLDLVLTVLAISLGLFELNPLMRYFLAVPALLLVVKCIIPVLIAWLIPGRLLLPAIALISTVIVWNVKELMLFLL